MNNLAGNGDLIAPIVHVSIRNEYFDDRSTHPFRVFRSHICNRLSFAILQQYFTMHCAYRALRHCEHRGIRGMRLNDRRKSYNSTAFRTVCVRHDKRSAAGSFAPAYLGERKKESRWGKKSAVRRRDELLRDRLIRDLIICCEKRERTSVLPHPRVSKLEDKFTTIARCSFSRIGIVHFIERAFFYCKNVKNKFSLYMLRSFFLHVRVCS